jgi:hypothetical protein
MSGQAIPALSVTDFRAFLSAAQAALASPQTVARLSDLLTRNERVLQQVREEKSELEVSREEHTRAVAKARRELDEELQRKRDAWKRELAAQHKQIERDMNEAERLRERVEQLRVEVEQGLSPFSDAIPGTEQPQAAA